MSIASEICLVSQVAGLPVGKKVRLFGSLLHLPADQH